MNLLEAKFGSKAIPSKPRSPEEFTVNETNGVANKAPFLTTRSCPVCWQTNKRPSGAKAIAVGLLSPVANVDSAKPEGSVAAVTRLVEQREIKKTSNNVFRIEC